MSATTRWVQYSTSASGNWYEGDVSNPYQGTGGYQKSINTSGDSFTVGSTTNKLYIKLDGGTTQTLTLYSGTSLDPRFIARNISELMHQESGNNWVYGNCVWEGDRTEGYCFKIHSGTLGTSSSVAVLSGTNSAHSILGFSPGNGQTGGAADTNTNYTGEVSISGSYYGFLDETYRVVITTANSRGIGTPSKGGSNSYNGTITTGGVFNGAADATYTLAIDATNGTVMGAGTGNVPVLTYTSSLGAGDGCTVGIELLYVDHWVPIGNYGLIVKFSDDVFNTCDPAWTIACTAHTEASPGNANAAVGDAYYVWSSTRGDDSSSAIQTVSGSHTQLGTRGLNILFGSGGTLGAKYEFYVKCTPPQPQSYNVTGINYGNVTVSTESDVKCVMFEVESGAVEVSTVKFSLQNNGTFSHHNTGNADTYFRFGTVGPTNNAGGGVVTGMEWWPNVVADDLDSDTPPVYLYATEDNLSVVATADSGESVGSYGLISDPMWLNIRLGASETGANSTINYRLYFDYS